uniref:Uncharacterized protein n=1 Tax=Euplotes harpa TaxID=151035 RepID=A0A7S3JB59_9SPIT|mmetsp:Transcript_30594/g.35023  ORF Transcript_30594/g.35023 Transcript_30594/m.35023 type:complete len:122 (+) Transcript_30594:402-767(+)
MQYLFIQETNHLRSQFKEQRQTVKDLTRLVSKFIKYMRDQEVKLNELRTQLNFKLLGWDSLKLTKQIELLRLSLQNEKASYAELYEDHTKLKNQMIVKEAELNNLKLINETYLNNMVAREK